MKTNLTPEYRRELDLATLKVLINISKNLEKKKGFESQFASVVVNVNIAEYILCVLINTLSAEVNRICIERGRNIKLEIIDPSGLMNRNKKDLLKHFGFANKAQIISLQGQIQSDRDKVYHNLIRSNSKEIHIDKVITSVNENTKKLRILVAQTLDEVWKDKNK